MDQESIVLEVDPRSVVTAIKQANQAVEGWEKGTVGAGERMQKSLERMGEMLLKVNDRSRSSMERLTQSIEKQAATYGKTEVERLIADRDRFNRSSRRRSSFHSGIPTRRVLCASTSRTAPGAASSVHPRTPARACCRPPNGVRHGAFWE